MRVIRNPLNDTVIIVVEERGYPDAKMVFAFGIVMMLFVLALALTIVRAIQLWH